MTNVEYKEEDLLSIEEASIWASEYLKKDVSKSNISYLIQYGKVLKIGENGSTQLLRSELKKYYDTFHGKREDKWKEKLGEDLNWTLSFDNLREKDTTKHVHRFHPYKGKFIPQLVEYFLDDHVDEFKKEIFFKKGDYILDPFCGSGTTLVQANELGINAIGVDVSFFNAEISNSKIADYDINDIKKEANRINDSLKLFLHKSGVVEFEKQLLSELYKFNTEYFPSPEFRYKVSQKLINQFEYAEDKIGVITEIYNKLLKKHKIKIDQKKSNNFLDKWFLKTTRDEIDYALSLLDSIENQKTKNIIKIILSRTIRTCRATTHSDLATLTEPQTSVYYCGKHKKICKPIFTIQKKWSTYSKDTIRRLEEFKKLRSNTFQKCLVGDSRTINIFNELSQLDLNASINLKKKKFKGIFSSPPYVGIIDYHEQHAYAYDLFDYERHDELEIGPLYKGQGKEARESYTQGITDVLNNTKKYLIDDFDIFLVANDKYNMYPKIAENCNMKIVNQYKRPVLNRTEKVKTAYSEIIFHLKSI